MADGTIVISTRNDYSPENYDTAEGIMLSSGQTLEIAWTALYEGEYTIDTLPEYQPKGYGAELMECMRYYQKYEENWMSAITNAEGFALFSLMLPVPMRTNPSANYTNDTEKDFDVFGVGIEKLLCEYITPKKESVYFAIKALDYPNKWICARHTIELSADL